MFRHKDVSANEHTEVIDESREGNTPLRTMCNLEFCIREKKISNPLQKLMVIVLRIFSAISSFSCEFL